MFITAMSSDRLRLVPMAPQLYIQGEFEIKHNTYLPLALENY
jgi:hypothetical protein